MDSLQEQINTLTAENEALVRRVETIADCANALAKQQQRDYEFFHSILSAQMVVDRELLGRIGELGRRRNNYRPSTN